LPVLVCTAVLQTPERSDGYGKLFSFLFSLAVFLASSGLFLSNFFRFRLYQSSDPFSQFAGSESGSRALGYTSASINPLLPQRAHSARPRYRGLLGTKRGKWFAIGFAVGMASHLFVDAFLSFANVAYIPGGFLLDKVWLILNGIGCLDWPS